MNVRKVNVAQLLPAPYNPRVQLRPGDPEYDKLKRSIATFGYVEPIIWNERTGHVVGGHQRLEVMKGEGATSLDVVVVSLGLNEEKALNVALNKIEGGWDNAKLAAVLNDLQMDGVDTLLTGFDAPDVDLLLASFRTNDSLAGLESEQDDLTPHASDTPATGGLGTPIIRADIIFDTEAQQARWQAFQKWVKSMYEGETFAERLDAFLVAHQHTAKPGVFVFSEEG